jgi:hypothetical protein
LKIFRAGKTHNRLVRSVSVESVEHHEHHGVDEALKRTGKLVEIITNKLYPLIRRWFGGLVKDVRRKLPHYKSDFTDAFRLTNLPQVMATALFMFIVQLTNLVTYGLIMRNDLNDEMVGGY